jgi:DNA-binding transcriptional ArsR family regulator
MDLLAAVEAMNALGQETRMRAFRLLVEAGKEGVPAGEIARRLDVPHNTMSTHLGQLTRAGLIRSRRESRSIIYMADLAGTRALLAFLVQDCCRGRPEACAPLLDAVLPLSACCPAPTRPA